MAVSVLFNQRPNVCVFDAYGTLFDVHSTVKRLQQRVGEQADQVSAVWRQKQLEYTWLRSLMGEYADFEQLVADSLDYALTEAGIEDRPLRDDLLTGYRLLDCFPEVPAVLKTLKQLGYSTAILSNGTKSMVQSCVDHNGIGDYLDDILSVDTQHIYKPSPRVYEMAIDRFGPPAGSISFQSANAWDIAGAAYFGFTCIWINRTGSIPEVLPGLAACTLPDLSRLPEVIDIQNTP